MAKATADIRSLAREQTRMGIRVLAQVATNPDESGSARVAAVVELFNRGWGRPASVHEGPDGGAIQVIIRQVVDVVDRSDHAKVIEHDDCDKSNVR